MNEYETSLPRAALGLLAGTATGAGVVALVLAWPALNQGVLVALQVGATIFVIASVVWAAGLLVVASLPWALLHYCRRRSWVSAVALGFVLTFVLLFAWFTYWFGLSVPNVVSASDFGAPTVLDGRLTLHGWISAAKLAALIGTSGAVVGFVVWRIAYRRATA